VDGLGHTGRLVTSAAIILFLAFAALAAGPNVDIKVFATGMAVGILLDATVVRALLVPAVVSLLGRWNWWVPWARSGLAEDLATGSGRESVTTVSGTAGHFAQAAAVGALSGRDGSASPDTVHGGSRSR
jgi:RND superfamily putative drug exporter